MSAPTVYTYDDVLENLKDFGSGHGFSFQQRMMRRAVQAAYRELVAVRDWRWLYKDGRIQLTAAYTTGTVAYLHSSGTYARELTLTDGTWPDWIEDAVVRFDDVVSIVESRKSDTVITLDVQKNPGADVAAGETYTSYKRWYPLPNDFVALWAPLEDTSWLKSQYRPVQDLAALDRWDDSTGDIHYYAIGPGDGLYGANVLYVGWPSDETETLDITYKRMPRTLRYSGQDNAESVGTITVTAGSPTVTCSGTLLDSGMNGSLLRIGTSGTYRPTGLEGDYPYAEQRTIIDVTGGTSGTLTLDANVATSRSGVRFTITDPVDLPVMAYEALLRCAEKHLARSYRKALDQATLRDIERAWEDALEKAKFADGGMIRQRRIAGSRRGYGVQVADGTLGAVASEDI